MLRFKFKTDIQGRIEYNEESRRDFDVLRDCFKTENQAARFARSFKGAISPFIYAVSPLGAYSIGMTDELVQKCKELNIEYEVEDELLKVVHPSFNVDDILNVPNEKYQYRDYQYELIEKLLDNGRGVIISPTRSGKSLVIAGLIHNVFQNVFTTKVQNVLILVPNVQLVYQFYDDLNDYGLGDLYHIQMFTAKSMAKDKVVVDKLNIYIANAQYILLHGNELPVTDMVFMDECHRLHKGS